VIPLGLSLRITYEMATGRKFIRLDTLLLIDKDRSRGGKGVVYIASPTLLY
jgi:hypothetical protein